MDCSPKRFMSEGLLKEGESKFGDIKRQAREELGGRSSS